MQRSFGERKAKYEFQIREAMESHLLHGNPPKPFVTHFAKYLGISRNTLHKHGIDRLYLTQCRREVSLALGLTESEKTAKSAAKKLKDELEACRRENERLLALLQTIRANAQRLEYNLDKLEGPLQAAVRGGREGRSLLEEHGRARRLGGVSE